MLTPFLRSYLGEKECALYAKVSVHTTFMASCKVYSGQCEVLINLPFITAAEDSDEDAEHVTGVDRSSADDKLLSCLLGYCNGGGGFFLISGVPAAKQETED